MPIIMTIPMNTRNPRTPGLISKGYAGWLLPHTATFDEKLVTAAELPEASKATFAPALSTDSAS
jgi:hypothetical protein